MPAKGGFQHATDETDESGAAGDQQGVANSPLSVLRMRFSGKHARGRKRRSRRIRSRMPCTPLATRRRAPSPLRNRTLFFCLPSLATFGGAKYGTAMPGNMTKAEALKWLAGMARPLADIRRNRPQPMWAWASSAFAKTSPLVCCPRPSARQAPHLGQDRARQVYGRRTVNGGSRQDHDPDHGGQSMRPNLPRYVQPIRAKGSVYLYFRRHGNGGGSLASLVRLSSTSDISNCSARRATTRSPGASGKAALQR